MIRFRTLIFLVFLAAIMGFLSIFAFNAYMSSKEILKDESQLFLSRSAHAIVNELDAHLRLMGQELLTLSTKDNVLRALEKQSETELREWVMNSTEAASQSRYQFALFITLDRQHCYLIRSRLVDIGPQLCRQLYENYQLAASGNWRLFRNGGQVLMAKDYLLSDDNHEVIGRLVGGIKLSNNTLLLNQLVNRSTQAISKTTLIYEGIPITEYHPKQTSEGDEYQSLPVSIDKYGKGLILQVESEGDSLRSLAQQLWQLLMVGVLTGLLVSGLAAAYLSSVLDKHLQRFINGVQNFSSKGHATQWQPSRIKEVNYLRKEIDIIVDELLKRRSDLKDANQRLSKALDEKRLILHQLIKSQEQERSHLAQELHDELGQLLTAVRVEAFLLEQESPEGSPSIAHSAKIKALVADMYETVYDRIMALRPVELDTLGLSQSIQQIPTLNSLRQSGVDVCLDIEEVNMPIGTDIHLYRIVQEALTNALKHAMAKRVSVSLKKHKEAIDLVISDDGQGFPLDQLTNEAHIGFGLLGIKERCEYMGAQLKITSEQGVTIHLRITLKG
ncbi:sensor histidine kinase [Neptunomonas concharum]|uniref:histidine kinase n=1 Tax=Neptunomonas concharum TaxID=1031538 RepID=A0A5P1RDH6_9GAMM|nr:ATP-binding protein [Neptunomonas concharum]QEQ97306.1 hypothetical protein F0U83_11625 [Neptunomonas concharum]